MPPKGSKASNKKNGFLGVLQRNKAVMSGMEKKILEQEKEIETQKKEFENLKNEVAFLSGEIHLKRRKLLHQKSLLESLESSHLKTMNEVSMKRKFPFNITYGTEKKRKCNPTTKALSSRSKVIRRHETLQACSLIHGGSLLKPEPVIEGMLDTLGSKFKSKQVSEMILDSKTAISNSVKSSVSEKWTQKFYKSAENKLRSLNTYYSHDVLGKRKYLNLRKANKQAKFEGNDIPNFVSYSELAKQINSIDIGELSHLSELCENYANAHGMYREPLPFILRLAKFYMFVNKGRTDKLRSFDKFPKKDPTSFLFAVAFGGDGAPGTGMSILVSFLNVGERIASSSEQFLLFGGDVDENSEIVEKFFAKLTTDLETLEMNVYTLSIGNEKQKVEFKVTELPNDMKMLAYLGGELSNAATFFTTFANAESKDSNDYRKSFGVSGSHFWKPFSYEKRLTDAKKVAQKVKSLENSNLTKSTKHTKITTYIAKELKSRQLKVPLVHRYIDCAKAEPLHLKNNTVKERFMCLFKICLSQTNLKGVKSFKEVPLHSLFYKFVNFLKTSMNCNFLSKKIRMWFNDNNGKSSERDFTFRFRGKESLMYLRNFPKLIRMIFKNITERNVLKKLLQVHYQSIHLRMLLSYSVRISDFTSNDLSQMKHEGHLLFKACCIFDQKCTPSLWTLCNVAPIHAEQCLQNYRLGLGCNTMEGREQKHQQIAKYAENTTFQNRWPMIFRHEFIQLIFLRENGYDNTKYRKRSSNYVLVPENNHCKHCSLEFKEGASTCVLCDNDLMKEIKQIIEN